MGGLGIGGLGIGGLDAGGRRAGIGAGRLCAAPPANHLLLVHERHEDRRPER
jgi:hypothetical protein